MKVSYNWLQSYIKVDLKPEDLGDIMTALGLEVEGLDEVESIKGGLRGVVIGKVIEKEQHPNADRLSVTKVDVGGEDLLQIVCGAPNVAAGQKVVVATIGTTLYDKDLQPWKIKKGKIRGEVSEGMICAEDELHMGQSHDGIMVLPETATVGMSAAEHFRVASDYVFDVGLTPNRSDATGHIGVAKDLLAYFRFHEDAGKSLCLPEADGLEMDGDPLNIEVKVHDEQACPRYSGICISDLKIGPGPKWISERLEAVGVRSINNVVDITNYVLQEYGQPLHAFDYDKIKGQSIIVEKLKAGTEFLSLDEVTRKLGEDDLMICDGQHNPMCIGGVFGGLESGVTDSTTRIFLESAHFEAVGIRKSSTHHLLRTDAAKCFEKGTDPNITVEALKRAVYLLKKYAGAKVSSELVDIYPKAIEPKVVELQLEAVRKLMGVEFSSEEIERILTSMDMNFETIDGGYLIKVPTNKADVTRPADIVEEILRVYGMDNVQFDDRHSFSINVESFGSSHSERELVGGFLVGRGFNEIMGISLMKQDLLQERHDLVKINNTSNIHLNVMRPSLLMSALESVSFNLNRQQDRLRLFEFGREYQMDEGKFVETEKLLILLSGEMLEESWKEGDQRNADFYDIKSEAIGLMMRMGIQGYQESESQDPNFSYGQKLHRGPSVLAEYGKVDAGLLDEYGIKQEVFAAIFNWKSMVKSGFKGFKVKEISKYPSMRRDLALVIDESVAYGDMLGLVKKNGGKALQEVGLFDVYRNEQQLGPDRKSYAIKLVYSDTSKTLSDKEVDKSVAQIVRELEGKLNAEVRR